MRRTAAVDLRQASTLRHLREVLITCAANRGGGRRTYKVLRRHYAVLITCAANRGGGPPTKAAIAATCPVLITCAANRGGGQGDWGGREAVGGLNHLCGEPRRWTVVLDFIHHESGVLITCAANRGGGPPLLAIKAREEWS